MIADAAPDRSSTARILTLLGMGSFVSAASLRVADPLLPEFAREFTVTPGAASIVVTSFALAYGFSQIFYGPLGDRFGKITVIAIAMVAAAIGIAGSALAQSLAQLSLARLVGGAGAAAIVPLAMAYIGDVVAYDKRQAVLARFLSGFIFGTAFGQATGGWFADHIGWRGLFVLFGILFLAVDLLLWREIVQGRVVQRRALPISAAMLATRYLRLLRRRPAQIVLLTVCAEAFLFYGAFAFVGAYLRYAYDLPLTEIGVMLACFGGGGLLYAALVKILVRRLGEVRMAATGGLLLACCFVLLLVAPGWYLVPPAIAGFGLGFMMLHNTLQVRATQMAPDERGIAVSVFASMLYLGQAAGVLVDGILIDRFGFRPVFGLTALLLAALALGFAASLRLLARD